MSSLASWRARTPGPSSEASAVSGTPVEPGDRRVEERARELLDGGDETSVPVGDDPAAARRAARRIIEDSEERTFDPATRDPEDDGVIRRSSDETA